ncbi:MAG: electron transfer flavoprotein subunit alpha/FixB family protein [Deltaproteobacteria bacterium]|nr:electron transfer flavoprotein subunit alpha/FixB family protein [Deltaproteobacteria bacterium]
MPTDNIMVIAETGSEGLSEISFELLGAAQTLVGQMGGRVVAVLAGCRVCEHAGALAERGANRVLVVDHELLEPYRAETHLPVLVEIIKREEPAAIFLGHTFTGQELGPRLAFRLGTAITTDCIRLEPAGDRVVMTKPLHGGNVMAEYIIAGSPQIVSLRPHAFAQTGPSRSTGEVLDMEVNLEGGQTKTRLVGTIREDSGKGKQLKNAEVIVSGGRGLGGAENWHYVEELAEALGAAIGATRAVVDAGWVPASLQIGLTGTIVSPELYIAVGISGAPQHIAGMSGARTIIAINCDPDANIFKYARYGVVGDWKEVLPGLIQRIKELREK